VRITKLAIAILRALGIAAFMLPVMAFYGAWGKLQEWKHGVRVMFSEIPWEKEARL
jgi:hypothetical protein